MNIRGVIFDLDGTLLDTLDDLAESMNSVLDEHNFPVHPNHAYRYFVGEGMENLVRKSIPSAHCKELLVKTLFDELKRTYTNRWKLKTKPYDGIHEVLTIIKRENLKLAVLSNKVHDLTNQTVKSFFNDIAFDHIIGQRDFDRKPSPDSALFIANEWGIPSNEIMFIGDSKVDMQTAKNASMIAAGVLWGFRDEKELLENGAEYIFKKPADIVTLLGNNL